MAHHDQRAVERAQRAFQFFDRGEIEMVGRFIQQQHQRRLRVGEHAGEACAQPLAAAQRAGHLQRRPVAECKSRQRRMGLVAGHFRVQPAHIVENTPIRIEQADMLVEDRDAAGAAIGSSPWRVRDHR